MRHLVLFFNGLFPLLLALKCYDSSFPVADRVDECPRPNMRCYSEYYGVNRSGTIRSYQDRFCVEEKLCLSRNIDGCKELHDLAPKVQKAFVKYHAKAKDTEVFNTRFCCCKEDLCNHSSIGLISLCLFLIPYLV